MKRYALVAIATLTAASAAHAIPPVQLADKDGNAVTVTDNKLDVNATVNATASSVAKSTAAAPSYAEGATDAPFSVDLKGNLRSTVCDSDSCASVVSGKLEVMSSSGSVVAIGGAAKGATVAGTATVTAAGADRNLVDVILRNSSGAELAQNANGQATMAASAPVVIASNQSAVPTQQGVVPTGTTFTSLTDKADGATASQKILTNGAATRYITDVLLSNGGTAQSIYITSGTGSTCGTNTAVLVPKIYLAANSGAHLRFVTPISVAANQDVCAIISGSTAYSAIVNGSTVP